MFWATAWDVITLGHSNCTARTAFVPPFVGTLGRTFRSTAVWVALVLLALFWTFPPTRLLDALRLAVSFRLGEVAHREFSLELLAGRLRDEGLELIHTHLWALGWYITVSEGVLVLLT